MRHANKILTVFLLVAFIFWGFRTTGDQEKKLDEIAKEYQTYRQYLEVKIDTTRSGYKWGIALCIQPKQVKKEPHFKTDSLLISKASSVLSPHGNKLYRLFVKDYNNYVLNAPAGQPMGQVIVKETWNVKEVVYDSLNPGARQIQSRNDGKWYSPTTVSELFIMYKESQSADNDKGWVYGIMDLENKKEKPAVLYNGKISSCISCHTGTKYDRIFGVK